MYLYCLETRCPETDWMVPMAPSWVISKKWNVYARLIPKHSQKRFEIEVKTGAGNAEMKAAQQGTVQNGQLVYELDGKVYRTSIRTLRGDYTDEHGNTHNRLRQWEKHDFKPQPDDIFQERPCCIQWITKESLEKSRKETYFASVTEEDLERERLVEQIVEENLASWQQEGLVPDMAIEPGYNTDQPIRERGWRYWQHLFSGRHILILAYICKHQTMAAQNLDFAIMLNISSRMCRINATASQGGAVKYSDVFHNQALNTLYNYGVRGSLSLLKSGQTNPAINELIASTFSINNQLAKLPEYSCFG